ALLEPVIPAPAPSPKAELALPFTVDPAIVPTATLPPPVTAAPAAWPTETLNRLGPMGAEAATVGPPALTPSATPPPCATASAPSAVALPAFAVAPNPTAVAKVWRDPVAPAWAFVPIAVVLALVNEFIPGMPPARLKLPIAIAFCPVA